LGGTITPVKGRNWREMACWQSARVGWKCLRATAQFMMREVCQFGGDQIWVGLCVRKKTEMDGDGCIAFDYMLIVSPYHLPCSYNFSASAATAMG